MSGADSIDMNMIFDDRNHLASQIADQWREWKGQKVDHEARVKEGIQYLYATSSNDTENTSNPWNNTTHIPKLTQIKDNLSANYMASLMPNDDWLTFVGENEDEVSIEKRTKIESYLKTKHRMRKFRNTASQLIDDWIQYGNCFAQVNYVTEKRYNPVTEQDEVTYSGPVVQRISYWDIVFNPLATDFKKAPKIIRRLLTIPEFEKEVMERADLNYDQSVLTKMKESRTRLRGMSNIDDFDKHSQLTFDGFGNASTYFKSGYVEVLEFYGDIYDPIGQETYFKKKITVVDRTWTIAEEDINTWSGYANIFHCGWRLRPDNLWAMSPIDNLLGMQYRINHLENSRADAFDAMLVADLVMVGDVEVQHNEDGSKTYVIPSGEGSVQELRPDTTMLNADFQIDRLMANMELFAGAPREAMGMRTPGEKTAFEVQELQNAAGRMFQNKITYFEEEFLEDVVNAEVEVARQYLDFADTVKVLDQEGTATFEEITKDDLNTSGKIVPVGARHFAEQARLTQTLTNVLQSMDQESRMHVSSIDSARALIRVAGAEDLLGVTPYVRISEQTQAQRLANAAQDQVDTESITPDTGEEEELL